MNQTYEIAVELSDGKVVNLIVVAGSFEQARQKAVARRFWRGLRIERVVNWRLRVRRSDT